MDGRVRGVIVGAVVSVAAVVLAPVASASITPTVSLDESHGTQAASTVPFGIDVKFNPAVDSPKDLTITLPPGLLAGAAVDGGACLTKTTADPACVVGTGTVVGGVLGVVPVTLSVNFYLVKPPAPADLGGLLIETGTTQLGSVGAISVRPSGDPAGVGLTIAVTGIPNFGGLIAVQEINSTFNAIRMPASCPATPATVAISADSYNDAAARTAAAPLQVTGCSSLPFTPGFAVTATKDATDDGAAVVADITQPVSPPGATPATVGLTLPGTVIMPNVTAVLNDGLICADPSSGTCKTIGTASATSPLYPAPLTGQAFLTGSLLSPKIRLIFPSPFPLSLSGSISLATNTTTFENVPDIPLTDLKVALAGGASAAFMSTCSPASGTATAALTTQDGRSDTVSSPFTVAGCTPPAGTGGTGGTGGSGGAGGPGGVTKPGHSGPRGATGGGSIDLRGLFSGQARLSIGLTVRPESILSFTVDLPPGLHFVVRRRHHHVTVPTLSIRGAKIKSIAVRGRRLTVVLRHATHGFTVTIGHDGLAESAALHRRAKHRRLGNVDVTVNGFDPAGAHVGRLSGGPG